MGARTRARTHAPTHPRAHFIAKVRNEKSISIILLRKDKRFWVIWIEMFRIWDY